MKPRLPNTTVNEARIFKMVNDVDTLKVNTERQLEGKFTEIDGVLTETKDVVKEAKSTLTETKSKLKQIDNNFENLSNEVVDVIKEIKATGLKGDRGDDGYTPVKGKDYFDGKTPEIDENKIAEKVIKLIPENKPSLKIIQESIDIDKVVEEVNKKLDEKPFEINKINGLSGRLDNITRDIARKTGYSGGGDTVAAGTGITITTNNAGSKVISAAGGVKKRVVTTTDDATAVIDVAVTDVYQLTAIANNTTFSFTGTPTDGQNFIIRYKDAGVSKTLTWTGFTQIGVTLPSSTTAGKWGYVGVTYNSAAVQYHAIAVVTEA